MKNMLYYPTILIPSEWMKKSILYCDSISSIYPYGFTPVDGVQESQALADMNFLKSEGLYSYSRPEDLSYYDFECMLTELQQRLTENRLPQLRKKFSSSQTKYEIYKSKLDHEIIRYLCDAGLAKESMIGSSLLVEKETALTYMSLLSAFSSNCENQYVPSTSSETYKNILYTQKEDLVNDNSLSLIFNKMPIPDNSNSLDDIIRFKNKHYNDLVFLRKFIGEWTEKLKMNPTNNTLNTFDDEYTKLTNDFQRMYKSEKINWAIDSLEIMLPFIVMAASTLASDNPDISSLKVGAISTSASVIVNSIRNVLSSNTNDNPLSYIYKANRELNL